MGIGTDCFRDGMVKDASGEPIIGASVVEAGTTNGIVTDLDGNFKLNVSAKGSLKIFFYRISDTNDSCSREKAV